MPHSKEHKNSMLAKKYGDPNKITRGDIIAAAIKKKKNKKPKQKTILT